MRFTTLLSESMSVARKIVADHTVNFALAPRLFRPCVTLLTLLFAASWRIQHSATFSHRTNDRPLQLAPLACLRPYIILHKLLINSLITNYERNFLKLWCHVVYYGLIFLHKQIGTIFNKNSCCSTYVCLL